jgi:hypothetical protein
MLLKNQINFNLLVRLIIIMSFLFCYQAPDITQIIISSIQAIYIVYFILVVRYTKIRYFTVNFVSNILTFVIVFCTAGASKFILVN